jgi:hypothetical protein
MTSFHDEDLDQLAPQIAWRPDWADVLKRAGVQPARARRRLTRRRALLALAVVLLVAVPLAAYATSNDWWFLNGSAPVPVNAPVVIKEGEWSGHGWELVAYRSATDGLCVSVTPKGSDIHGQGGAMGCAPIAGVSRTSRTKQTPDMTITYLSGGVTIKLPPYIAGPVVETATEVEIRYRDGEVVKAPTFPGPDSLGHVRFYAVQLPADLAPKPRRLFDIDKVIGRSTDGSVVACLVPRTAVNGVSPLSACVAGD